MNLEALEFIARAKAALEESTGYGRRSRSVALAITKLDEARLWIIESSSD